MTDAPGSPLAPSYAVARRRFLAAAASAGAGVTTHRHPMTGPRGEELAVDVATVGPDGTADAVLVVSGTHGVEGFAGSALQHWWLTTAVGQRPADVRVVLLHAFNPYGFAWVRRANEDNVDLNRNFVDWAEPTPTNDGYGELADLLVPETWTEEAQEETTAALLALAERLGLDTMQAIISGGQYHHPTGVFYGGTGPVWSHALLRDHLAGLLVGHERLAIIDLHTGLGPWGHGELISHESVSEPGYARATSWWGDVRSMIDGDSVSATVVGDWLARVGDWLPGTEVTAAALEFGTIDPITVLQALRADAWLHAHGDPTGPAAGPIRSQVRAAFADDDPAWFDTIRPRFDEVLQAAFARLGGA
ncbi:MAG: DUF2817 domain-containing protein [Acidimicrobiales bacterium]|nr:DUF2817 domain-containing protein [Acidimicrobiales bacterium]